MTDDALEPRLARELNRARLSIPRAEERIHDPCCCRGNGGSSPSASSRHTLLASVARTHRLILAEGGVLRGGVGGPLARVLRHGVCDELDVPIERVLSAATPIPFAPVLEARVGSQLGDIATAVRWTPRLVP